MNATTYASIVDPCDAIALSLDGRLTAAAFTSQLRFAGFGLFRAEVDRVTVPLPPITRTMLARLVLARGGLVDADDLYRDSWPEPAPTVRREQRVAVHKRIAELRRCLASARVADHTCVLLTERSARTGYRLLLDADLVDIHLFEDRIFRAAATRDAVAVGLLAQALMMWTERPLLGLPDKAFVQDNLTRLTRLRDRARRELAAACRALCRIRDTQTVFDHLHTTHADDKGLPDLVDRLPRPG